jgi:hypothetical protein
MRAGISGIVVLLAVVALGAPAFAHHSHQLYFDTTKAITLEGDVVRLEWINPHILLFLQSKNEQGEPVTWIIQGASLNNADRQAGLKERLKPGVTVAVRIFPSRTPLYVNEKQTVLLTRPDDPRTSPFIVGGGQVRFANGDIMNFGAAPRF